jgi:hypothetical protein
MPRIAPITRTRGYRLLSPDETKHYLEVEKPRLLKETRQKAHLINTIHKMFEREPSLIGWRNDPTYEESLHLMPIARLEDEWDDLRSRSINPGQKLPPMPRFRSDTDAESKRMLAGVETNASTSMEELEAKLGRARRSGWVIEVTPSNARSFA